MPLNWDRLQAQIDAMAKEIREAGAEVKVEVIMPARESVKLSREEYAEMEQRRADLIASVQKRAGGDLDEACPTLGGRYASAELQATVRGGRGERPEAPDDQASAQDAHQEG